MEAVITYFFCSVESNPCFSTSCELLITSRWRKLKVDQKNNESPERPLNANKNSRTLLWYDGSRLISTMIQNGWTPGSGAVKLEYFGVLGTREELLSKPCYS